MNYQKKVAGSILLPLMIIIFLQVGCSNTGTSPSPDAGMDAGTDTGTDTSDLSQITEISSSSEQIAAAAGGTVVHGELTAIFPAAALPIDAQIKASKVSLSNSKQASALVDLTSTYVLSTTSSSQRLELVNSATVEFGIDPQGFGSGNLLLVVWDGANWIEVPAEYDEGRKVISTTAGVILPFGTRIYRANGALKHKRPGVLMDHETISEFVAVKVVAAKSLKTDDDEESVAKALYIRTERFTVEYFSSEDEAQAQAVSDYMENAYANIIEEMGFKQPGPTSLLGYGKTWPVIFEDQGDAYGRADDGYYIEVQPGTTPGDDLSHTCHHEFFHLVQYKTLTDAGNKSDDGLAWFDETTSDAIGFYAQHELGVAYSSADTEMGYFDVRLDSDEDVNPDNDDYEYLHFPFISYLLATFGHDKFRTFFETLYAKTPGKEMINMATMDTVALDIMGKTISGRVGIYWDFYRDYFIAGGVFNQEKFPNLANRSNGSPFDLTEDDLEEQGVTLVTLPGNSPFQKNFNLPRLSGQVLLIRYSGSSEESLNLSVDINSSPGQSSGHIQLISFKRSEKVLEPVGTPEEVSDGAQKKQTYEGFGSDIHEIYVVMTNTSLQTDDYTVSIDVTAGNP